MGRTAKNVKITTFKWVGTQDNPENPLELTVPTGLTAQETITIENGDVIYVIEELIPTGSTMATRGTFKHVVGNTVKPLPRQPKPGELVACTVPATENDFLSAQMSVMSSDGTIYGSTNSLLGTVLGFHT